MPAPASEPWGSPSASCHRAIEPARLHSVPPPHTVRRDAVSFQTAAPSIVLHRIQLRTSLLLFHRWVALTTSALIFLVATTGSALVFEGAMDRGMNPQLWRVTPSAQPVSFDTAAAHASLAAGTPVTGLTLSADPGRAWVTQSRGWQTFVDPYSGAVIGKRALSDVSKTLPRRLHSLHASLMTGAKGSSVVALVTLAAFLLTLTGIVIWWQERRWRIRWSASWKRIVFDLHHSLGIVASLVLFFITASGLALHYPIAARTIARLDTTPRAPAPRQPSGALSTRTIPLDSLASVARRALPGASILSLSIPASETQPFLVAMRFPEDHTPGGRSHVYVDRFRGTPLAAESTRDAQPGAAINDQMYAIHTGDVFGKPTEAVWLLAALVLASQSVSGLLMWWNGRAGRAALARSRRATR